MSSIKKLAESISKKLSKSEIEKVCESLSGAKDLLKSGDKKASEAKAEEAFSLIKSSISDKKIIKTSLLKSDMYEDEEQLDKSNIKGVHASMKDLGYHKEGESRAGAFARAAKQAGNSIDRATRQTKNYNDVAAKELHAEKLKELKSMPKPNLGKSLASKLKSTVANIKHGAKKAAMGVDHATDKFLLPKLDSSYNKPAAKQEMAERHSAAKAKLNSEKPNLGKAKVDESLSDYQKKNVRSRRNVDRIFEENKGVNRPSNRDQWINSKTGRTDLGVSRAGSYQRHGDAPSSKFDSESGIDTARRIHQDVIAEQKRMPKPNLGKAKIDDGLGLEDKVRGRQARNLREVKTALTPTGQKTRTLRSTARRQTDLENGIPVYDKPDSEGRMMRVRGVPVERRQGEKIVGTPRTMQNELRNPLKTSTEATYGVHMHSGSMAGKDLPVGGGKTSAAPVSADKEGKSYIVGGNKSPIFRHRAVMHGQENIRPNLPKSESMNKADHFKQSIPKAQGAPKLQSKPTPPPKMQSVTPTVPKPPKMPKVKGM